MFELIAGWIWKGDILIADLEDMEKLEASEILSLKDQRHNKEMKSIPSCRWYSKIVRKRPRIPRTHSEVRINSKERRSQWRTSGESQPTESTDDAEDLADFWSIQGDFIYRHHNEPRDKLCVAKEETFPLPMTYIDETRSTYTDLDVM